MLHTHVLQVPKCLLLQIIVKPLLLVILQRIFLNVPTSLMLKTSISFKNKSMFIKANPVG